MNILIDIGHPAHVHVMKHFGHELEKRGHRVLFTCRQKEFVIQLLEEEGFRYVSFGRKYDTALMKLWGLVKFDYKMWRTSLHFNPDMYISLGSMYAAQVSALMRKPHICFEDTYNMEQVRLYRPFTDLILTGDYEHPLMSKTKEFRMAGYNELAYLHPNRFTPDENVLKELGVKKGEKYVIGRFVALNASHDIGHHVLSNEEKIRLVESLNKYATIFISSEMELPDELEPYRLTTHPSRIHDILYYASLVISESATMAEESAILGTPAIYINENQTYYTDHLERDYKIIFNYSAPHSCLEQVICRSSEILSNQDFKNQWRIRCESVLMKKIDVTALLLWIVENYPESKHILKENPDYQFRYK